MEIDDEAMLLALSEGFYQREKGRSDGEVFRAVIRTYLFALEERGRVMGDWFELEAIRLQQRAERREAFMSLVNRAFVIFLLLWGLVFIGGVLLAMMFGDPRG